MRRIQIGSDSSSGPVRPLVRNPVCRDRLVTLVELGRFRGAHRIVVRALRGPVGQVEDLLVEARGIFRR